MSLFDFQPYEAEIRF